MAIAGSSGSPFCVGRVKEALCVCPSANPLVLCTVKGRGSKAGEVCCHCGPRALGWACHRLLTVLPHLLPQSGFHGRCEQIPQVRAWERPDSHSTGKEVRSVETGAQPASASLKGVGPVAWQVTRCKEGTGLTDTKPPKSFGDVTSSCQ